SLGITLGLGAELFQRGELQDRLPDHMEPLPDFDTDHLVSEWCDGDLMLHVAAEDPVVVSTAVGHLLSLTRDHARVRWSLPGFQRSTVAAEDPDATPRNLMGQIDGTVNPHPSEAMFDVQVLTTHSEPGWARAHAGTYHSLALIRTSITYSSIMVWASSDDSVTLFLRVGILQDRCHEDSRVLIISPFTVESTPRLDIFPSIWGNSE